MPKIIHTRSPHASQKARPHWFPAEQSAFELSYLSWGYRWYGTTPIGPLAHEGWHYFVVLEGTPGLVVGGRTLQKVRPGLVCVTYPGCPVGHSDKARHRCRILTWIWQSPPSHSALQPPEHGFLRLQLEASQLRRIDLLHTDCRKAVAVASERSMLVLRGARIHLDLCLLEAREYSRAADGNFRFNLAIEYIRNHLTEEKPITRLCEYLQMSEASLKRLFRDHASTSPRAFMLDLKMQFAVKQLSAGPTSVKAVAYALGYKHANDFSRAFKRHQGFDASRLQKR